MAFTFSSTSQAAIKTAGANVNATIIGDAAQLIIWSDQIEAEICDQARFDCVSGFSSITSYGRLILAEIHDAKLAQYIIAYEPESIGTIGASIRLNFLQNVVAQGMSKIDDSHIKKYLSITS